MASVLSELLSSPSCSCMSSFDGEGDGNCPVHNKEKNR